MNEGRDGVGAAPAAELAELLATSRRRLAALVGEGCSIGCTQSDQALPPCLDDLHAYLLDELVPVLHAVRLRIRPALRRHLGRDLGALAPADAVLMRLVERVALLRAACSTGEPRPAGAELGPLLQRLAEHAAHRLDLDQRTLPVLVAALPADVAGAAVASVRRTADAVRAVSRSDLAAGAL